MQSARDAHLKDVVEGLENTLAFLRKVYWEKEEEVGLTKKQRKKLGAIILRVSGLETELARKLHK